MADDQERRDEEQEGKIRVRDRRRVTMEGDVREVEEDEETPATHESPAAGPAAAGPQVIGDGPTPTPEAGAAGAQAEAPSAPEPEAPKPGRGSRRGSALGGADEARVKRDAPRLQEVEDELAEEAEGAGAEGERPQIRDVYDYIQAVASEMTIWSISALGLMANPITRIVTTDMDQAEFSIDAAEALIDLLIEQERIDSDQRIGLYYNFVLQFASVAAQILRQPPQVRIRELSKVRFCIDTADRFADRLSEVEEDIEPGVIAEVQRTIQQLRLEFVQASGGGGIVG